MIRSTMELIQNGIRIHVCIIQAEWRSDPANMIIRVVVAFSVYVAIEMFETLRKHGRKMSIVIEFIIEFQDFKDLRIF
jgi:hypothetical protein